MGYLIHRLSLLTFLLSTLSPRLEGSMNYPEACSHLCGDFATAPGTIPWASYAGDYADDDDGLRGRADDSEEIIPPPPKKPGGVRPPGRPIALPPDSLESPGPVPPRPSPGQRPSPQRPPPPPPTMETMTPTGTMEPMTPMPPPEPTIITMEPTGPTPPPDPGPIGPNPGPGGTFGELNFNWNTQVGWNTTFYGNISGGREHESNIILDNGGYIKDKDWLKWGAGFESNPWIVSNVGIRGGLKFGNVGGRRKRRATVDGKRI